MIGAVSLLLAEDDLVIRTVLSATLTTAGYRVTVAASGAQALAYLREPAAAFAVVVSDVGLGDYDGIDVLKAARALPRPPEVILLTGYGRMEIVIEALRGGACDFLEKPVNPETLLAAVARAMARYHAEQRRNTAMRTILHGLELLQTPGAHPAPQPAEAPPPVAAPATLQRYISVGKLKIDTFARTATCHTVVLHLTPTEYTLLLCLAEAPGRVLSYDELARRIYDQDLDLPQARALLKGHAHNLRSKLPTGTLRAVRGVGYVLQAQEAQLVTPSP